MDTNTSNKDNENNGMDKNNPSKDNNQCIDEDDTPTRIESDPSSDELGANFSNSDSDEQEDVDDDDTDADDQASYLYLDENNDTDEDEGDVVEQDNRDDPNTTISNNPAQYPARVVVVVGKPSPPPWSTTLQIVATSNESLSSSWCNLSKMAISSVAAGAAAGRQQQRAQPQTIHFAQATNPCNSNSTTSSFVDVDSLISSAATQMKRKATHVERRHDATVAAIATATATATLLQDHQGGEEYESFSALTSTTAFSYVPVDVVARRGAQETSQQQQEDSTVGMVTRKISATHLGSSNNKLAPQDTHAAYKSRVSSQARSARQSQVAAAAAGGCYHDEFFAKQDNNDDDDDDDDQESVMKKAKMAHDQHLRQQVDMDAQLAASLQQEMFASCLNGAAAVAATSSSSSSSPWLETIDEHDSSDTSSWEGGLLDPLTVRSVHTTSVVAASSPDDANDSKRSAYENNTGQKNVYRSESFRCPSERFDEDSVDDADPESVESVLDPDYPPYLQDCLSDPGGVFCPICKDPMQMFSHEHDDDEELEVKIVSLQGCSHKFHKSCILGRLRKGKEYCPVCLKPVHGCAGKEALQQTSCTDDNREVVEPPELSRLKLQTCLLLPPAPIAVAFAFVTALAAFFQNKKLITYPTSSNADGVENNGNEALGSRPIFLPRLLVDPTQNEALLSLKMDASRRLLEAKQLLMARAAANSASTGCDSAPTMDLQVDIGYVVNLSYSDTWCIRQRASLLSRSEFDAWYGSAQTVSPLERHFVAPSGKKPNKSSSAWMSQDLKDGIETVSLPLSRRPRNSGTQGVMIVRLKGAVTVGSKSGKCGATASDLDRRALEEVHANAGILHPGEWNETVILKCFSQCIPIVEFNTDDWEQITPDAAEDDAAEDAAADAIEDEDAAEDGPESIEVLYEYHVELQKLVDLHFNDGRVTNVPDFTTFTSALRERSEPMAEDNMDLDATGEKPPTPLAQEDYRSDSFLCSIERFNQDPVVFTAPESVEFVLGSDQPYLHDCLGDPGPGVFCQICNLPMRSTVSLVQQPKFSFQHGRVGVARKNIHPDADDEEEEEDKIVSLEVCAHKFHKSCIQGRLREGKKFCPLCLKPVRVWTGKMPSGSLRMCTGFLKHSVNDNSDDDDDDDKIKHTSRRTLVKVIMLEYQIPCGIQKSYHVHPGRPFQSDGRFVAYLPGTDAGYRLCQRLETAFSQGHTFEIVPAAQIGRDEKWDEPFINHGSVMQSVSFPYLPESDVVAWSNIPHITSLQTKKAREYLLNPLYLSSCHAALDALGVASL